MFITPSSCTICLPWPDNYFSLSQSEKLSLLHTHIHKFPNTFSHYAAISCVQLYLLHYYMIPDAIKCVVELSSTPEFSTIGWHKEDFQHILLNNLMNHLIFKQIFSTIDSNLGISLVLMLRGTTLSTPFVSC